MLVRFARPPHRRERGEPRRHRRPADARPAAASRRPQSVGGAMSWGEPKTLAPFRRHLAVLWPDDSRRTSRWSMSQVDGAARSRRWRTRAIASLSRRHAAGYAQGSLGQGQVVSVPRHRQCRMVHIAALGALRRRCWSGSPSRPRPSTPDRRATSPGTIVDVPQRRDGRVRRALEHAGTLPGDRRAPILSVAPPLGRTIPPGLYASARTGASGAQRRRPTRRC